MDKQVLKEVIHTLPDQWVTDRYCKELLKLKAIHHFRGKIDLGKPDMALFRLCKQELQHRGLIVPHINFRVNFPNNAE